MLTINVVQIISTDVTIATTGTMIAMIIGTAMIVMAMAIVVSAEADEIEYYQHQQAPVSRELVC